MFQMPYPSPPAPPPTVARTLYTSRTLVGNWYEDAHMTQAHLDRGDRPGILHRNEQMVRHYTDNVQLEQPCLYMRFGARVQLLAPDFPAQPPAQPAKTDTTPMSAPPAAAAAVAPRWGLSLYLLAQRMHYDRHIERLSPKCSLSVAPADRPCRRNVFRLRRPPLRQPAGSAPAQLHYGEPFQLELMDAHEMPAVAAGGDGERVEFPLLLYSAPPNMGETYDRPQVGVCVGDVEAEMRPYNRGQCDVTAVRRPPLHTLWKVVDVDPNWRFEREGELVKSNDRILICHVATNQLLAVENLWAENYFGAEANVTLGRYETRYHWPTYQNIWLFQTAEQQ